MKRALPLALLLLSACQAIGDFTDDLGSHMPVIGERCEHWQCFTSEGQKISDANKKDKENPPPPPAPEPPPAPTTAE